MAFTILDLKHWISGLEDNLELMIETEPTLQQRTEPFQIPAVPATGCCITFNKFTILK